MKTTVITTDFQFSHGKAPRGFGNWAFAIISPRAMSTVPYNEANFIWARGPYGEAKKQACAEAKARGISTLYLMG
jgi:hypothetical protein